VDSFAFPGEKRLRAFSSGTVRILAQKSTPGETPFAFFFAKTLRVSFAETRGVLFNNVAPHPLSKRRRGIVA
jgi:hypothetical protein